MEEPIRTRTLCLDEWDECEVIDEYPTRLHSSLRLGDYPMHLTAVLDCPWNAEEIANIMRLDEDAGRFVTHRWRDGDWIIYATPYGH